MTQTIVYVIIATQKKVCADMVTQTVSGVNNQLT
nr:MAG TPA: hypothetical protein [Caudoviricetes sp.]